MCLEITLKKTTKKPIPFILPLNFGGFTLTWEPCPTVRLDTDTEVCVISMYLELALAQLERALDAHLHFGANFCKHKTYY